MNRWARAIANAVSSGTPAAVSPMVRPASVTPIPPGTGMRLENNDTMVLMRMNVLSGSSYPKARVTIASVVANRISEAEIAADEVEHLARHAEHLEGVLHLAERGRDRLRTLGTKMTIRTATTSTPRTIMAIVASPLSSIRIERQRRSRRRTRSTRAGTG